MKFKNLTPKLYPLCLFLKFNFNFGCLLVNVVTIFHFKLSLSKNI